MKCKLPGCNKEARRKFCCNRHKDKWHNWNNPRGKFSHLHPDNEEDLWQMDTPHPFSGEGIGQD